MAVWLPSVRPCLRSSGPIGCLRLRNAAPSWKNVAPASNRRSREMIPRVYRLGPSSKVSAMIFFDPPPHSAGRTRPLVVFGAPSRASWQTTEVTIWS